MDLFTAALSLLVTGVLALEVVLAVLCPFLTLFDELSTLDQIAWVNERKMRFTVSSPSGSPFVPIV